LLYDELATGIGRPYRLTSLEIVMQMYPPLPSRWVTSLLALVVLWLAAGTVVGGNEPPPFAAISAGGVDEMFEPLPFPHPAARIDEMLEPPPFPHSDATSARGLDLTGRWASGICRTALALGDTILVGKGGSIEILDLSSPGLPTLLGRVVMPSVVEDIAVCGAIAYVACRYEDVRILDIGDLTQPQEIGVAPASLAGTMCSTWPTTGTGWSFTT
jgi:hypothetical protein